MYIDHVETKLSKARASQEKPSSDLSEPCFSAVLTWYLWELKDKEKKNISTMSVDGAARRASSSLLVNKKKSTLEMHFVNKNFKMKK